MTETTAPATDAPAEIACACSSFYALVNVRDVDNGDLLWDAELTTGCTATTRNTFAPGHDAKLKGFLIKMAMEPGAEIHRMEGAVSITASAEAHADKFGFGHMVHNGIRNAEARLAAKQAKKDARAAKKARRDLEDGKAEVVTDEATVWADQHTDEDKEAYAEPITAKVGRWTYKGNVFNGEFTYADKNGNVKTTTKFTEV